MQKQLYTVRETLWQSNSNTKMYNWSRPEKIVYKRWRNPDMRCEENFVQQSDEDMGADQEICTIASGRVDTGEGNSASNSKDDKTREAFTVDGVLDVIGFGKFQWKLSVLTGLLWTADAMEMMILSILGPQLRCEWRLPSYKVALITSMVFLGTGICSPMWGKFFDKNGRRIGLMIAMFLTAYFGLLSAFAPAYGWLLLLRGLVGLGIAASPQAVTLYTEFLPTKLRGTCVMLISIFWAIGAVFEVLLALLVMPTLGWRWLLGFSASPIAIVLCFFFWLPESPRFHMLTGNTEKAVATLKRIAKENGKALPQGKMIVHKQRDRGQMKDVFSHPYCKTTCLLCFIWFVNAFSYYGIVLLTTELFQSADTCDNAKGGTTELSCNLECKFLSSADYRDLLWTTLAEIPGVLFVLLLVDRIGRRKSMALGFFMFSLFVLPLYACIGRPALTILIFIARAFITGGYQAVYVYTPEVFPTENRALAMGTCSAMARIGALITPFVSEVMLRYSVYLALSIYCGCCLLAGIACLILPIETLGRGLQESNQEEESGVQSPTTTSQPRSGASS